ncbi:TPA: hypothetical protein HA281_05005 [Candidatus Woesearchaeota archaeon]|nr:MAG: metalloprotease [archaeon GW2011_AR11]HIH04784.1 hypothetical protein [Candidatus Woesearchaeota archaeon]HIH92137.1 hypothetical protein [Candidatus Woesearchaeota archaeon]HII65037.1 hypothetical protein [Candidatus Woesearchaeota archaeon]HIJ19317.1 hypothetical protein [Candidatus Woesearchaeota archaeon]
MGVYAVLQGKVVIGLSENVEVRNSRGKKTVEAKIDTGATKSSMDMDLARKLHLGPVIKSKMVKSAHGNMLRPVVEATIILAGKTITEEFTLADRKHLKYAMLIGQNVLKNGFLIDPSK